MPSRARVSEELRSVHPSGRFNDLKISPESDVQRQESRTGHRKPHGKLTGEQKTRAHAVALMPHVKLRQFPAVPEQGSRNSRICWNGCRRSVPEGLWPKTSWSRWSRDLREVRFGSLSPVPGAALRGGAAQGRPRGLSTLGALFSVLSTPLLRRLSWWALRTAFLGWWPGSAVFWLVASNGQNGCLSKAAVENPVPRAVRRLVKALKPDLVAVELDEVGLPQILLRH